MDDFDARPGESIASFVNKYPLTVPYFQKHEEVGTELSMSLNEFRRNRNLSWAELDRQLQKHLAGAVMPEAEDCRTLCVTSLMCGKKITISACIGATALLGFAWWVF